MKHLFIFGIAMMLLAAFISSCTGSKISKEQYCTICLQQTDTIVVDIDLPQFDLLKNDELNDAVMRQFKNEGFDHVFRWHELEYELLKSGLKQVNTAEDLKNAHEHVGIKYVISSNLERYRDRAPSSKYVNDVDLYSNSPQVPGSITDESSVKLYLLEAKTNKVASQLTVFTQSKSYGYGNKAGSFSKSVANAWKTLCDGTSRGAKFMVADCQCPKGHYALKKHK